MAPLRPSARTLRAQRISGEIHPSAPPKTFRPAAATTDSFLSTKHDKRLIKHSSFVARVTSSRGAARGAGVSKKRSRKARPTAAGTSPSTSGLASTSKSSRSSLGDSMLDGLADALPELGDGDAAGAADGKIQHRSLRSKRGALRRKERVVRGEMARFGASMARLAEGRGMGALDARRGRDADVVRDGQRDAGAQDAQRAGRWAALRGFISSSMKQNPAFEK